MQKYVHLLFALILAILPGIHSHAQGIITTIAGNGITQYIGDGFPATSFSLAQPAGICVDKNNNVIIADFADMRIRMVDSADTLSTIAGIGLSGYSGDSGLATAARIRNADGVCLDTAGNLYITEWYNDVVRRVDGVTGIITTVCGNGTGGFGGDGGPATAANMETPGPACMDRAGNIYIPDYGNHRVRKVTVATGIINTVAGTGINGYTGDDGLATAATLSYPNSVSVDTSGNLYISEFGNSVIRKVDAVTGIISTVAGNGIQGYFGDGGLAVTGKLRHPNFVFADKKGMLYISDNGNNVIRCVDTTGLLHTVAGTGGYGYAGDGGLATSATFSGPASVYVTDANIMYISDGGNSVIRKVTPVVVHEGIAAVTALTTFKVYPDPSNGQFTIETNGHLTDANIQILNTIGQVIFSAPLSDKQLQVDLIGAPAGIYYVQCSSLEGRCMHGVIIQ